MQKFYLDLQVLQVLQVVDIYLDGLDISNFAQEPLKTFLGTNTLAHVENRSSGQIWHVYGDLFAYLFAGIKKKKYFCGVPKWWVISYNFDYVKYQTLWLEGNIRAKRARRERAHTGLVQKVAMLYFSRA